VRSIKHSKPPHSQASKACGLVTRATRAAAERSDRTLSGLDWIGLALLLVSIVGTAEAFVLFLVPPSPVARDAGAQ